MTRSIVFAATVGAVLAIGGTARADVPVPPPNLDGCNGVVVAAGDHPDGAPAFYARYVGLPVNVALEQARQDFQCAHP